MPYFLDLDFYSQTSSAKSTIVSNAILPVPSYLEVWTERLQIPNLCSVIHENSLSTEVIEDHALEDIARPWAQYVPFQVEDIGRDDLSSSLEEEVIPSSLPESDCSSLFNSGLEIIKCSLGEDVKKGDAVFPVEKLETFSWTRHNEARHQELEVPIMIDPFRHALSTLLFNKTVSKRLRVFLVDDPLVKTDKTPWTDTDFFEDSHLPQSFEAHSLHEGTLETFQKCSSDTVPILVEELLAPVVKTDDKRQQSFLDAVHDLNIVKGKLDCQNFTDDEIVQVDHECLNIGDVSVESHGSSDISSILSDMEPPLVLTPKGTPEQQIHNENEKHSSPVFGFPSTRVPDRPETVLNYFYDSCWKEKLDAFDDGHILAEGSLLTKKEYKKLKLQLWEYEKHFDEERLQEPIVPKREIPNFPTIAREMFPLSPETDSLPHTADDSPEEFAAWFDPFKCMEDPSKDISVIDEELKLPKPAPVETYIKTPITFKELSTAISLPEDIPGQEDHHRSDSSDPRFNESDNPLELFMQFRSASPKINPGRGTETEIAKESVETDKASNSSNVTTREEDNVGDGTSCVTNVNVVTVPFAGAHEEAVDCIEEFVVPFFDNVKQKGLIASHQSFQATSVDAIRFLMKEHAVQCQTQQTLEPNQGTPELTQSLGVLLRMRQALHLLLHACLPSAIHHIASFYHSTNENEPSSSLHPRLVQIQGTCHHNNDLHPKLDVLVNYLSKQEDRNETMTLILVQQGLMSLVADIQKTLGERTSHGVTFIKQLDDANKERFQAPGVVISFEAASVNKTLLEPFDKVIQFDASKSPEVKDLCTDMGTWYLGLVSDYTPTRGERTRTTPEPKIPLTVIGSVEMMQHRQLIYILESRFNIRFIERNYNSCQLSQPVRHADVIFSLQVSLVLLPLIEMSTRDWDMEQFTKRVIAVGLQTRYNFILAHGIGGPSKYPLDKTVVQNMYRLRSSLSNLSSSSASFVAQYKLLVALTQEDVALNVNAVAEYSVSMSSHNEDGRPWLKADITLDEAFLLQMVCLNSFSAQLLLSKMNLVDILTTNPQQIKEMFPYFPDTVLTYFHHITSKLKSDDVSSSSGSSMSQLSAGSSACSSSSPNPAANHASNHANPAASSASANPLSLRSVVVSSSSSSSSSNRFPPGPGHRPRPTELSSLSTSLPPSKTKSKTKTNNKSANQTAVMSGVGHDIHYHNVDNARLHVGGDAKRARLTREFPLSNKGAAALTINIGKEDTNSKTCLYNKNYESVHDGGGFSIRIKEEIMPVDQRKRDRDLLYNNHDENYVCPTKRVSATTYDFAHVDNTSRNGVMEGQRASGPQPMRTDYRIMVNNYSHRNVDGLKEGNMTELCYDDDLSNKRHDIREHVLALQPTEIDVRRDKNDIANKRCRTWESHNDNDNVRGFTYQHEGNLSVNSFQHKVTHDDDDDSQEIFFMGKSQSSPTGTSRCETRDDNDNDDEDDDEDEMSIVLVESQEPPPPPPPHPPSAQQQNTEPAAADVMMSSILSDSDSHLNHTSTTSHHLAYHPNMLQSSSPPHPPPPSSPPSLVAFQQPVPSLSVVKPLPAASNDDHYKTIPNHTAYKLPSPLPHSNTNTPSNSKYAMVRYGICSSKVGRRVAPMPAATVTETLLNPDTQVPVDSHNVNLNQDGSLVSSYPYNMPTSLSDISRVPLQQDRSLKSSFPHSIPTTTSLSDIPRVPLQQDASLKSSFLQQSTRTGLPDVSRLPFSVSWDLRKHIKQQSQSRMLGTNKPDGCVGGAVHGKRITRVPLALREKTNYLQGNDLNTTTNSSLPCGANYRDLSRYNLPLSDSNQQKNIKDDLNSSSTVLPRYLAATDETNAEDWHQQTPRTLKSDLHSNYGDGDNGECNNVNSFRLSSRTAYQEGKENRHHNVNVNETESADASSQRTTAFFDYPAHSLEQNQQQSHQDAVHEHGHIGSSAVMSSTLSSLANRTHANTYENATSLNGPEYSLNSHSKSTAIHGSLRALSESEMNGTEPLLQQLNGGAHSNTNQTLRHPSSHVHNISDDNTDTLINHNRESNSNRGGRFSTVQRMEDHPSLHKNIEQTDRNTQDFVQDGPHSNRNGDTIVDRNDPRIPPEFYYNIENRFNDRAFGHRGDSINFETHNKHVLLESNSNSKDGRATQNTRSFVNGHEDGISSSREKSNLMMRYGSDYRGRDLGRHLPHSHPQPPPTNSVMAGRYNYNYNLPYTPRRNISVGLAQPLQRSQENPKNHHQSSSSGEHQQRQHQDANAKPRVPPTTPRSSSNHSYHQHQQVQPPPPPLSQSADHHRPHDANSLIPPTSRSRNTLSTYPYHQLQQAPPPPPSQSPQPHHHSVVPGVGGRMSTTTLSVSSSPPMDLDLVDNSWNNPSDRTDGFDTQTQMVKKMKRWSHHLQKHAAQHFEYPKDRRELERMESPSTQKRLRVEKSGDNSGQMVLVFK